MKKVGVVTGTRAEYGLLKSIIQSIEKDDELEACVIVTGMHLEERFGTTCKEIEKDKVHISYKIPMSLYSDSPEVIVHSMGIELGGFADVLNEAQLDMLVVLGDRYEIITAALAAIMFRIPIAHIHGGELTEGAVDDAIRHAITKMSALHFVSTEEYAKRVIQMGEQPDKVFCVGAPGIENIKKIPLLSRQELIEKFGRQFSKDYIMVTYHPVTLENVASEQRFENLLQVLEKHKEYNYVLTYANADTGGESINRMIEEYVNSNSNSVAFRSMGQEGYLSALKYCKAVVGNSSSGIIEAPTFHVPTVNIGERQTGRVKAKTVIDCGNTSKEIEQAFMQAVGKEFQIICQNSHNPYEGSQTAATIVKEIKKFLDTAQTIKKKFYSI